MGNFIKKTVMEAGPYENFDLQVIYFADFLLSGWITEKTWTVRKIVMGSFIVIADLILYTTAATQFLEMKRKNLFTFRRIAEFGYVLMLIYGYHLLKILVYVNTDGHRRTIELIQNDFGFDWKKYEHPEKNETHYEMINKIQIVKGIVQMCICDIIVFYVPRLLYVIWVDDDTVFTNSVLYILPMGYTSEIHSLKLYCIIHPFHAIGMLPGFILLASYKTTYIVQALNYKNILVRLANCIENDSINTRQQIEFFMQENTNTYERNQKIEIVSKQFQERFQTYLIFYRNLIQ